MHTDEYGLAESPRVKEIARLFATSILRVCDRDPLPASKMHNPAKLPSIFRRVP